MTQLIMNDYYSGVYDYSFPFGFTSFVNNLWQIFTCSNKYFIDIILLFIELLINDENCPNMSNIDNNSNCLKMLVNLYLDRIFDIINYSLANKLAQ